MSDSQDGMGSPSSPATIRNEGIRNFGNEADLSVVVERRIWNLIQLLSNCVGDISKEKQITNKKMEDHNKALKDCLADIESGLNEQLKIMEESLMSTDFNCSRALYDHQIETMDEMFHGMKKFLGDSIQRTSEDPGQEEFDAIQHEEIQQESNPADFPNPILPMDPNVIGRSILRHDDDPPKDEDERFHVRFDKSVRKRLFKAPAEEYEYPDIHRLTQKISFHKALKARNVDVENLWENEGLLRAEGFALLAGADQMLDDEVEEEEGDPDVAMNESQQDEEIRDSPPSPKTDDVRELEALITEMKVVYHSTKKKYEDCKEMLDKNEENAPTPEQVHLLLAEAKQQKIILKNALQKRNQLREWTEEDHKQRRKEKLAKKLVESRVKPKRIEKEKPTDYMSSSSSESSGPGSVHSDASFLNSDSSELSPGSNIEEDNEEAEKEGTSPTGDFTINEDDSLHQPPSAAKESGEDSRDVEMEDAS